MPRESAVLVWNQAQNALEKIVKKKIQFTEAETIQQVLAFLCTLI